MVSAIATILFAVPAMAKITLVGLRGVSREILEAGTMAGCTPRQMLWRVRIPAARRTLMVGVNQVIMLCLAMKVISSFIGARGLGIDLLFRLQTLQLGRALENGVCIVLMAIALDRLSQALAVREPEHRPEGRFWDLHPCLTIAGAVIVIGAVVSYLVPAAATLPKSMTLTFASEWDVVTLVKDAPWHPTHPEMREVPKLAVSVASPPNEPNSVVPIERLVLPATSLP